MGTIYPEAYMYDGTHEDLQEERELKNNTGEHNKERWITAYELYDRIGELKIQYVH